jgi:hypothetical protein
VADFEQESEPPTLVCSHLIACYELRQEPDNADSGYSLGHVLVHVRPGDGRGFPFRAGRIFLFAQLHGSPEEFLIHVRQVRIEVAGDEEITHDVAGYGPWEISIPGENYVECFGIPLAGVPFPEAGVYEFQLRADGSEAPLAVERVEARE